MSLIFDTHAHYDDEAFDADRETLLASMPEHGVGLILDPGCDLESSRRAVELARTYPHVYAAVGWHPENCAPYTEDSLDEESTSVPALPLSGRSTKRTRFARNRSLP